MIQFEVAAGPPSLSCVTNQGGWWGMEIQDPIWGHWIEGTDAAATGVMADYSGHNSSVRKCPIHLDVQVNAAV